MPNISGLHANAILDWSVGGANPTRPAARYVGFSLDLPSASSFNEVGAGSGYARQSAAFAPAASGSTRNAAALAWAVVNWALCPIIKPATLTGGNLLWFGSLSPPRSTLADDAPLLAVGAIEVSIS